MMRSMLSGLCWLLCVIIVNAQQPPQQALSSLTVADGLKLELFASEPMFSNPTCIDIDERGRVWVCESVNYRYKLLRKPAPNRPEGDRIVILHDTNGDGKADKAITFYQAPDFLAPLGIAVSKDPVGPGYKVYVCHSPHIYVFEDKDGDGKADGPPKILLTGFGGIDHDHGVHGIHFGPDGKLYFSVGDQGVRNLKGNDASGGQKPPEKGGSERSYTTNHTDCKAGTIWRCNTDGSCLELLAHNFRNQYEPAVNSFGTMFVSDNDDDGSQQTRICHVMYGGDYGYWPRNRGDHHWHEDQPGIVHKTLRTGFGSPTGLCWYEGKLLQPAFSRLLAPLSPLGRGAGGEGNSPNGAAQPVYEGYLLHTDAGPREVRLFGVRPKGAGYELDRVNLVTSTDNWFRPSDVCVAPDGSVFIADWYDPGVGGHGMGDTTRGRIYRLTPLGHKGYQSPSLHRIRLAGEIDEEEPDKQLTTALLSPNIAARELGFQVIDGKARGSWMTAEAMLEGNDRSIKKMTQQPYAQPRLEQGRRRYDLGYFQDQIMSKDPFLACLAIRLGVRFYNKPMKNGIQDHLRHYEAIKSIFVAREALLSLPNFPLEDIKETFYDLATRFDGQDRTYLSAINIAAGTDPQRREALLAEFEKHFPTWNDKTAWLVWELRPPKVIAKLGNKLVTEVMTPQQTELALGALAASSGNEGGESLLILLKDTSAKKHIRSAALTTLLKYLPGKWSSLKDSLLVQKAIGAQMSDIDLQPAVIELIAACERKDFLHVLAHVALDSEGHGNAVRLPAIAALGQFRSIESVDALVKLLIRPEHPVVRQSVLQALGKIATPEALKPLQTYFLSDKIDMEDRRLALTALASNRPGINWLLDIHKKHELPDAMLAETARLLRSSPYQDLRNKALIVFPLARKLDLANLPSPSVLAKKSGNPEHGKQIVHTSKDLGCIKCHSMQGIGGQIGPDLSMIGIKASKENLFESILSPDKAIADQFVQYVIESKNGVIMTGLIVEENSDYLVLRDANGRDSRIALREIESRVKSAKSIMPDNLASFLSEDDLVDVVAWLATLKSPALTIDRWHVIGPFPNDANDSGLDKKHGPEHGYDAQARYTGKTGSVQWKSVNVNADNYLDLAALHGDAAPLSVSYVYAEIDAPKEGWGEIKLGTDDGVNVQFNDKLVFKHRRHEAAQPARDTISVEFKKGKNTLLLQVSNGNNPHGLYCTVLPPGTEPARLLKP